MTDTQDRCLNCGAALSGQYCGQCGQRATSRLISLWELVRDAFGDLFELDSRLWQTLVPLLARPGRLTREYLEGRRARYMPPFRMYLVLSLVFFVVAFFDPHGDFEIFFEPDGSAANESAARGADDIAGGMSDEQRREVRAALEELVREGVLDESMIDRDGLLALPDAPSPDDPPASPGLPGRTTTDDTSSGAALPAAEPPSGDSQARNDPGDFELRFGEVDVIDCTTRHFDLAGFPAWVQRRATPERLTRLCERWKAVGAEGIQAAILDRIPAALILLLPLMALVLKLLYPLSRRYYVEHLLFFVHFHSFFFVLLTLQILWSRTVGAIGLHEAIAVLPIVASSFYVPVYLFVSMRRVYGQGRFVTFLKFLVLAATYLVSFALMLLGAFFLAALSV